MFKQAKIWDPAIMTPGSAIKITGYSGDNEKEFKGEFYLISTLNNDIMTVIDRKGYAYSLPVFECEPTVVINPDPDEDPDDYVKITMIAHIDNLVTNTQEEGQK
jgi:hypothetical protein